MAIIIKTKDEIAKLREGGQRLATVVKKVAERVVPGVSAKDLDEHAEELIREYGDVPSFLNDQPLGSKRPYPATLCISINDEVVHGIPNEDRVIESGDIVSVDCGVKHDGLFTDHAVTIMVGEVSDEARKLVLAAEEALALGIKAAKPGDTVGDIGYAIESFINNRYGIIRILSGHGVGRHIHEDPYVPNFGEPGTGAVLEPGMVIAIEPMITLGSEEVDLYNDGYTYVTKDRSLAAHFEHTVLITDSGPEILTKV